MRRPKTSLLRRYAVYLSALLSMALLASGAVELYFTYHETRAFIDELQAEKARAAAVQIEQFLHSLENQLKAALLVPGDTSSDMRQIQIELLKILRSTPALVDAAWVDSAGYEQVSVSRFGRDTLGAQVNRSSEPSIAAARSGRPWYGAVEFRRLSEPHMSVAIPGSRDRDGVLLATINLRFILDVVARIRIGESGQAYIVDERGMLVSHPDPGLVLRRTDLSHLPQVQAGLAQRVQEQRLPSAQLARDASGQSILSTHVHIEAPRWLLLVEQPISEAFAPLYAAVVRTLLVVGLGVAAAVFASALLARRMMLPIRALDAGVRRIAAGHLDERVRIESADELQALADQFNRMAQVLHASHADLERRIEERTRELAEANRAKTRFVAAASHDLKQPVHALGLFVAQLTDAKDPALREQLIGKVAASSTAVSELIDSLLDISKLEAGNVEPRIGPVALQSVFDRLEQAFTPAARETDLRLRIRPTGLRVHTDAVLLERILLNLCSNAIRYTRQGGVIVAARLRSGHARIEVRDTGIGIAPEALPTIFDEYHQVEVPQQGLARGLGLGLAIVKRLSELLGHDLEVHSLPGRGSLFVVTVPLATRDVELEAESQDVVLTGFGGLPVLLVDDDAPAREATEGLLRQWGCRVASASSGREALESLAASTEPPRLVICDYRLAEGELGTAVIEQIRNRLRADIPAVLITAETSVSLRQEATAAGLHLLQKPLHAARLRALLQFLSTRSNPRPPAPSS